VISYLSRYKKELEQRTNKHITLLDFDSQALNYASSKTMFSNIDYSAISTSRYISTDRFKLLKHSKVSLGEYWKFIPSDLKRSYDIGVCFSLHTVPIVYLVHTIYNAVHKCKEVIFCIPSRHIDVGVMLPWENLFRSLKGLDFKQEMFDDGVFVETSLNGY